MELLEWIPVPVPVLRWVGLLALLLGLGSLVLMPLLVIAIPRDYFMFPPPEQPLPAWWERHPLARLAWRVLRNALGATLVLLGIAMLVLPGQGLLTILVGLVLLEFPGKRELELRLMRRRHVRRSLDWIRRKAGRAPLAIPSKKEWEAYKRRGKERAPGPAPPGSDPDRGTT